MLGHTKKHHTDVVKITFVGPAAAKDEAIKSLLSLGFVDASDSIAWRDAFPEFTDEELPGAALAGARAKEGLTQQQLSDLTGIPQRHISEMENGKRQIGKERAKKLAKVLKVNYRIFL